MDAPHVLVEVRKRIKEGKRAPSSPYRSGYLDALFEIEEWLEDRLWDEGDEEPSQG